MDTLDTHFKAAMNATERIGRPVATLNRYGSLLPSYIDGAQPSGTYGHVGFGGESDSYYEYLVRSLPSLSLRRSTDVLGLQIKQHHLLGEVTDQYKRMYTEAIDSAYEFLVKKVEVVPGRPELLIAGDHVRLLALSVVSLLMRVGTELWHVLSYVESPRMLCWRHVWTRSQAAGLCAGLGYCRGCTSPSHRRRLNLLTREGTDHGGVRVGVRIVGVGTGTRVFVVLRAQGSVSLCCRRWTWCVQSLPPAQHY